jgi:hypothetical protein
VIDVFFALPAAKISGPDRRFHFFAFQTNCLTNCSCAGRDFDEILSAKWR